MVLPNSRAQALGVGLRSPRGVDGTRRVRARVTKKYEVPGKAAVHDNKRFLRFYPTHSSLIACCIRVDPCPVQGRIGSPMRQAIQKKDFRLPRERHHHHILKARRGAGCCCCTACFSL